MRGYGLRPWLIGAAFLLMAAAWIGLQSWHEASAATVCRQRYAGATTPAESLVIDQSFVGDPGPRFSDARVSCGVLRMQGTI